MTQIEVPLESWERRALHRLARMEKREPAQQAAVLLSRALEQAGVLKPIQPLHQRGNSLISLDEGKQATS